MGSENIPLDVPLGVSLGVLESISSQVDLSWFVMEINLQGKDKREQEERIARIECQIASIGYDKNKEFSHDHYDGVYHLLFLRGKPNA